MTSTASHMRRFEISFGVKLDPSLDTVQWVELTRNIHSLEMLLEVQYRLETLSGTITNGVTLRWSAERPGAFALMSVILPKVHGIAFDLRLVQPLEGLCTACTVRLFSSKPGLDNSLRNESDIPQLTPVRPGHHHTFLPKPHEIRSSPSMLLESNALGAIDVPPNYEVHHLVDRSQVLEIRIVIFGEYKVVDSLESSPTKRREGALLVLGENEVQTIKKSGVGRI